jgi:AraC-like DNA-binding protein
MENPEMSNIKSLLQKTAFGIQIKHELKQRVAEILEDLLKEKGFKKLNLLLVLLNEIAENPDNYRLLSSLKYNKISNPDTSRIGKVVNYLQSHFKDEIMLNEVAEVANLTPNAFCKYFKKRTNKSFVEYLNELRINHSCELLMTDMYSVKEVAAMTGFKNRSNFNRRFFKVVGKTPSDFSNEYKEAFG